MKIREFLSDESGFLTALLPALVGGAGASATGTALATAAGTLGDQYLSNRADAKTVAYQNNLNIRQFRRLRRAADKGGIHVLEALRSGASVPAQAPPRLMSTLARTDAFDELESVLTGEQAAQDKRVQIEDEIRERELDLLRHRVAGTMTNQASPNHGRPPVETFPNFEADKSGRPQQRPGYWSGKTIPVNTPTHTVQMPVAIADRLGLKAWDPVTSQDLEDLTGDELSQLFFADYFGTNALKVREGNTDGEETTTSGDMFDALSPPQPGRLPQSSIRW